MKNIGLEVRNLLDKLYNLKSDDSIILEKIKSEKEVAEATKVRTTSEKESLTEKISGLENEEVLLTEEGELLKEALKNVNRSSFNVVLNKIGIDFNPGDLCFDVDKKLPETINKIKEEKESSLDNLATVERDLSDSLMLIDELDLKKGDAVSNQHKLKEYFELALKGNVNTTRDNLTTLLAKFGLSEDEQRESAKILMFPEDSLFEYERNYKDNKTGKSFSDVFKEAKVEMPEPTINVVSESVVPVAEPEEFQVIDLEEELVMPEVEKIEVENIVKTESTSNLKEMLEKNDFDYSNFTGTDISFLEQNMDEVVFEKNIKLIKDMGINKDIFIENIELFIDDELESKLKLLLEIGKLPFDIYLNPNILIKYDVSELQTAINSLKESGLDPKKVPLMAY